MFKQLFLVALLGVAVYASSEESKESKEDELSPVQTLNYLKQAITDLQLDILKETQEKIEQKVDQARAVSSEAEECARKVGEKMYQMVTGCVQRDLGRFQNDLDRILARFSGKDLSSSEEKRFNDGLTKKDGLLAKFERVITATQARIDGMQRNFARAFNACRQ